MPVQQQHPPRGRSRSRARDSQRGRSATPSHNPDWWYHQKVPQSGPEVQAALLFSGKRITSPSVQAADSGDALPAENCLHVFNRDSRIEFLVDSGSVILLLPRSMIKNQLLAPGSLTLCAANSSPIASYSTHSMVLNLGLRRSFRRYFIIADVQFLTHFGLLVDLLTKRLCDHTTGLTSNGSLSPAAI